VRKLKHDACLAISTYLGSSAWQLGLELFRDAQQRGTGRQGRAGQGTATTGAAMSPPYAAPNT
jgi:hypothetical protein